MFSNKKKLSLDDCQNQKRTEEQASIRLKLNWLSILNWVYQHHLINFSNCCAPLLTPSQ